jgi:hypothetical protein
MPLSTDCKALVEHGDTLFKDRIYLDSLWQEIADHFYVERADFTLRRLIGDEFAAHLDTSYPLLARRELGNAFGSMLRPPQKEWFHIRMKRESLEDSAGRQWLEKAEKTQRRAMYDRESGFVRATKEGDHDFAAFGQMVMSIEIAHTPDSGSILLHRCWHLRDVAWSEDPWGRIGAVHRKWSPTARYLNQLFPGTVHENVKKLAKEHPYTKIKCRHIVIPTGEYGDGNTSRKPYISFYIDIENETEMEQVGIHSRFYVIPRWQTVSGSQYAFSPATVAALPDARLIQSMTYTLLTAGEKAVDPPLVGVQEALKGGIEAFPGGFTPVDAQYDERLGEALRALPVDWSSSIPLGLEMTQDTRAMIAEAFYLNSLNLPDPTREMTAYETSKRIEEYIRGALPLFEPMENDYNGTMCETEFGLMLRAGGFGPFDQIPDSIRNEATGLPDVEFHFESPLREAADRIDSQRLMEAKQLIVEMAPLDPLAPRMLDARVALRDALHGIQVSETWLVDEEGMEEIVEEEEAKAAAAQAMQVASAGAQVAEQIGTAGQAMGAAEQMNQEPGVV